jgi:hypothetical protein
MGADLHPAARAVMLGNGGVVMTEAEWLDCEDDPWEMFESLGAARTERKSRLFVVACLRRIWAILDDERSRRLVEIAERHLEGAATDDEWATSTSDAVHVHQEAAERTMRLPSAGVGRSPEYDTAATRVVWAFGVAIGLGRGVVDTRFPTLEEQVLRVISQASSVFSKPPLPTDELYNAELLAQCHLLRDIFGTLFRPATFSPAWRTDTVLSLAGQMYESRDFGAMPILADALQDAGCDNDDILGHCRDANATHVRGCWVVDLVLGKE